MKIVKYKDNSTRRGQALIFVFFLLLVIGVLSVSLAVMLRTEIQTRMQEKNGLTAFYLAQSGIEYAKIILASNESWGGVTDFAFGGGTFTVSVQDLIGGGVPKEITSTGKFNNAERMIIVWVYLDPPPPMPNTPGDETVISWSWGEK